MNDCKIFVGLDDHQDSVQVCVMDRAGRVLSNSGCKNDASAILTAWIVATTPAEGSIADQWSLIQRYISIVSPSIAASQKLQNLNCIQGCPFS